MSRAELTDFALLEAWRSGDRSAGQALFQRHFPAVFRFVRSKIDDGADDLTQKIFLALVEHPEAFERAVSFRAYLFGVARNQLLMWLRAHARREGHFDPASWSVIDAGGSPAKLSTQIEQHRVLLDALTRLPVDQQVAIEMHYLEELSTSEIAQVLEVPVGTVKARLSRAREALREQLARSSESASLLQSTIDRLDHWIRGLPSAIRREGDQGEP